MDVKVHSLELRVATIEANQETIIANQGTMMALLTQFVEEKDNSDPALLESLDLNKK